MGLFTLDRDLLPENWGETGPSGKPVLGEPPEVRPREPVYLVTDTSWWMEQGWRDAVEIAEKMPEAFFVVPAGVMRELDGLKKNAEKGRRALESIKRIEELIRKGRAKIETRKSEYYNALASKTDEEVVAVAKRLKEKKLKTLILTTDKGQIALAFDQKINIARIADSSQNHDNILIYLFKLILALMFFPFILIYRLFVPYKKEEFVIQKISHPLSLKKQKDDAVWGEDWLLDPVSPLYTFRDD